MNANGLQTGVVTHIVQNTYPAEKVWGGIVVCPGNAWEQFMSAMAHYQANGQLDTRSAMLPYFFFNSDIIIQQFVHYDGVERPEAFAPFYNITSIDDQTQIWDSFSAMISSPLGYSLTRYVQRLRYFCLSTILVATNGDPSQLLIRNHDHVLGRRDVHQRHRRCQELHRQSTTYRQW